LLVACDIDGTLVRTGSPVTPAVLDAVSAVRTAGHHFVLSTGRSLAGALPVARELGLDDAWVVSSNGAVTAHVSGGTHSVVECLSVPVEKAVRVARKTQPGVRIAAEVVGVGYRVSGAFPRGELNGAQDGIARLDELWATPTPRLAMLGPNGARLALALRALGLTAHLMRADWVDVTPPNVSKATALENVRARLGVEDYATVAIGDGENDLEMLAWAAEGYAMGHAPAPVLAAADVVTGSIHEDGAAAVLRGLVVPNARAGQTA
jgi:HAD superfamily hydrolase (TIGR01484 family)